MSEGPSFKDFWDQKYSSQSQYFFTSLVSQRIGSFLAYSAHKIHSTPNAVSVLGLLSMLGASYSLVLSYDSQTFGFLALFLFQIGYGLDCADGQLARATGVDSRFGAWLDNTCDYIRQIAIVLALGANLLLGTELPYPVIGLSMFLLGSGLTVDLYTVGVLKSGTYRPHGLSGAKKTIKNIVMNLGDTPVFLLIICLLIQLPVLLVVYISLIGLLHLLRAYFLALLRIY